MDGLEGSHQGERRPDREDAEEPGSFEDGYIWSQSGPVNYGGKVIETYGYDADGRLATEAARTVADRPATA